MTSVFLSVCGSLNSADLDRQVNTSALPVTSVD